MKIAGITTPNMAMPAQSNGGKGVAGTFGEALNKAVAAVNGQNAEGDELAKGIVSGEHARIHETMIAMEKASISGRLLVRVQGKVLDAYNEVMRLQL